VIRGEYDIVETLMSANADINCVDIEGKTALDLAMYYDNTLDTHEVYSKIIKILSAGGIEKFPLK
jgi:ankyrin repeat protein